MSLAQVMDLRMEFTRCVVMVGVRDSGATLDHDCPLVAMPFQKDPLQSRDPGVAFYVHDSEHEMYRWNGEWRIADAAESKLMYVHRQRLAKSVLSSAVMCNVHWHY